MKFLLISSFSTIKEGEHVSYIITGESAMDLPHERMDEYGIPFVSAKICIEDDWFCDDMKADTARFTYASMRAGKHVKTAAPNYNEYVDMWQNHIDRGNDILHIATSSSLSLAYRSALQAQETIEARNRRANITIVDSLALSGGMSLLLMHALENRDRGLSLSENVDDLSKIRPYIRHRFVLSTDSHLRNSGRASLEDANEANAVPVMRLTGIGSFVVDEYVEQRYSGCNVLLSKVVHNLDERQKPMRIHIVHTDCLSESILLRNMLEDAFPQATLTMNLGGAGVGAHMGPGALSVFFIGREPR